MNFALPIVVSDKVGCGPDLVRDGYNGFVFRSGDVEGLRSALAALVASDALRKEYGAHSAALVQEYSVEACADQLVKAFLTVAATPGQRW
jgi:glycosyltransferase involved in cell wall biosynthesis